MITINFGHIVSIAEEKLLLRFINLWKHLLFFFVDFDIERAIIHLFHDLARVSELCMWINVYV